MIKHIQQKDLSPEATTEVANSRYLKVEIYSKLLIAQSKFSGSRKFTLSYQ